MSINRLRHSLKSCLDMLLRMLHSLSIITLNNISQSDDHTITNSLKEGGHVMVFLDRSVVIEDGQLGAGLDMEVVGGAGVVVVVDDGGQEDAEYLQVGQPGLEPGLGDEPVSGL